MHSLSLHQTLVSAVLSVYLLFTVPAVALPQTRSSTFKNSTTAPNDNLTSSDHQHDLNSNDTLHGGVGPPGVGPPVVSPPGVKPPPGVSPPPGVNPPGVKPPPGVSPPGVSPPSVSPPSVSHPSSGGRGGVGGSWGSGLNGTSATSNGTSNGTLSNSNLLAATIASNLIHGPLTFRGYYVGLQESGTSFSIGDPASFVVTGECKILRFEVGNSKPPLPLGKYIPCSPATFSYALVEWQSLQNFTLRIAHLIQINKTNMLKTADVKINGTRDSADFPQAFLSTVITPPAGAVGDDLSGKGP